MRKLPISTRRGADATASPELEIGLFKITHPVTGAVVRLSTDNTERLSARPLMYGTRSSWLTPDPASHPFVWVIISVLVPDDKEEGPGSGQLMMDGVDESVTRLLRSFTEPARFDLCIVRAADINTPIEQWLHYELVMADGGNDTITLSFSRDRMTSEPSPYQRMNRSTTPGLHR